MTNRKLKAFRRYRFLRQVGKSQLSSAVQAAQDRKNGPEGKSVDEEEVVVSRQSGDEDRP